MRKWQLREYRKETSEICQGYDTLRRRGEMTRHKHDLPLSVGNYRERMSAGVLIVGARSLRRSSPGPASIVEVFEIDRREPRGVGIRPDRECRLAGAPRLSGRAVAGAIDSTPLLAGAESLIEELRRRTSGSVGGKSAPAPVPWKVPVLAGEQWPSATGLAGDAGALQSSSAEADMTSPRVHRIAPMKRRSSVVCQHRVARTTDRRYRR